MKHVISITLGLSAHDYAFETEFLGQSFRLQRIGTNGDMEKVRSLLQEWDSKADAIGLRGIRLPYALGPQPLLAQQSSRISELLPGISTPVTSGERLHKVGQEWSLRYVQFKLGNNYFNNTRALFLSGMMNYDMAAVMSEYTDNLRFADPMLEQQLPFTLNSVKALERYAQHFYELLKHVPSKPLSKLAIARLRRSIQAAHTVVIPPYAFYQVMDYCKGQELNRKIIITATAYDDQIALLKDMNVDVVIDTTPKILERVVGLSLLEAMIIAALGKSSEEVTHDDLLEVVSEQRMDPRVIYPSGEVRRINRFAFVIHPLSQEFLKKDKAIERVSRYMPKFFMDMLEKVVAYFPPWVYSKVTNVKSPDGVEAEGWLITIGGTPHQMLAHSPEFTYKRLIKAAEMAKRMGAQIMGLGAFTKVVGDAGITVAKMSDIPITTGNSYSASGALWAATDAVRRMGIIEISKGNRLRAKAMVVGATGAIGSVCSRLLVYAFEEVYMVDVRDARLMALRESILEETPDAKVHISTRADKFLPDMDVIVTATSAAGKTVLDITKVKPGCVITDVARPLDLSPEDVAKRPDVLVIESGEIKLPGDDVKIGNIGLPPQVAYACLAETIVLALEGRYEIFTIGRNIEWEKVREIYRLGLKHGMGLAAISGVNGMFSDEDIARVAEQARLSREKQQSETSEAVIS
ncbi:MAG: dehydrogenase [Candidatus Competibacteraceae bacterium]|jgi:predicted amino acid dehydrogenase|nr:dehydrogenase [Candidatus Competibacteraceae bacterium]